MYLYRVAILFSGMVSDDDLGYGTAAHGQDSLIYSKDIFFCRLLIALRGKGYSTIPYDDGRLQEGLVAAVKEAGLRGIAVSDEYMDISEGLEKATALGIVDFGDGQSVADLVKLQVENPAEARIYLLRRAESLEEADDLLDVAVVFYKAVEDTPATVVDIDSEQ